MRCRRSFFALSAFLFYASSARAWDTCESGEYIPPHHAPSFEIGCWGDTNSHLHAFFTYAWRRYPDDPPPAILHGRRDGEFFRPNVRFQIGNGWKGPWRTIGRFHAGDEALRIDNAKRGAGLVVQVDVFRRFLRSGKYGRVVLESGESGAFKLDIFLPEKNGVAERQ